MYLYMHLSIYVLPVHFIYEDEETNDTALQNTYFTYFTIIITMEKYANISDPLLHM